VTRPNFIARVFLFLLALCLTATSAQAASATGKLVHSNGSPAMGITVTLANANGRSPMVQSGKDGTYSLTNIPDGQYSLEVWVDPKTPQTYQVTVNGDTNLPQVTVP
jgi:hypothetical protein